MNASVFNLASLDSISSQGSISLEVFNRGWYHNVVYLGQEQDIPILTMTCPLSNVEGFKTGKLPLCAPSKEYANVLVKGLVEGGQFLEDEAIAYIKEASTRPI
ncbi:histone deacetylase 5-like [Euphorbia lathyris]|uniref:histone deacetylase 5-like n=1 Tax=Euphorbia lathyris TaxID=212925 RepID=UPI0033131AA7